MHQPIDQGSFPTPSASDQRWRLLFEQSPLSIQVFAPDGQTIRCNQAWINLFGLTPEQGYAFNPLKDPDLIRTGAVQLITKAFQGETVVVPPVPFPVNGDPPSTRWIGGTLYPVTTPDGALQEVVVIHHDITELKEAEETTRRLNEILEERVATRTAELSASEKNLRTALDAERQINLLKTSFVGMVSHEFRTPLGIINTATELLSRHHDKLAPEQRGKHHESIMGAVKRMTGMMEHILLLARIDSGNISLNLKPVDLATWMPEILEELRNSCPVEHSLHLELGPPEAPLHALLDESLLHHVIGNLFSNACKYSPPGSPIHVTLRHHHAQIFLTVRDRGVGIPEDEQAHLFEGFFRGSNVGNIPGTGLGLTITQRCVELLGGTITLRSLPGEGTTFSVTLPLEAP
jgi:PAS domain S-box-containing protein